MIASATVLMLTVAAGAPAPTERAAPSIAGAAGVAEARSPGPRTAASRSTSPLVVAVDPGHGGTNLGAAGAGRGVYEKRLMLSLGERVRDLLVEPAAAAPAIAVVLCRESDALVPIRARARCAQENGARLFLSLHANAVPAGVARGSQRGFEVFVLGPREVEDDAALAALEKSEDAEAVWAAHEVRAAAEQSIILARTISDHLSRALGGGARRGVKQAGATLDVLRGAGTAAALVEVGFIDHPVEGARLASPEGREPIARALADAVRAYLGNLPAYVGRDASGSISTSASAAPTRGPRATP